MKQASILLVEDEPLIRMMLLEMIEEIGHTVVAEAGTVVDARSLAEIEDYDLAILDINLQGLSAQPVAEAITARGLPLFFLSGYGSTGVPDGFKGAAVLSKPCSPDMLKDAIDAVLPSDEPNEARDKSAGAS
jgi:DNA-binding response OmpR family regulator